MNDLLTNLLKLQAFEFNETAQKASEAEIAELKAKIPQPILCHYERLVARGKKGVALVRNQVCTGCHMRLPIGTVNTLMQGQDIQLCDSCGRYLCLPVEAPASESQATPESVSKPPKRSRKRKALASIPV